MSSQFHISKRRTIACLVLFLAALAGRAQILPGDSPQIVGHPISQTASPGGTVTFGCEYGGMVPFVFQWFFTTNPIAGATNDYLTVSQVNTNAVGEYHVAVTNPHGTTNSQPAFLSLFSIGQDKQLTIIGKKGAPYLVEARDSLEVTNQWQVFTNVVINDEIFTLVDGTMPHPQQRFYRANVNYAPLSVSGLTLATDHFGERIYFLSETSVRSSVFGDGTFTLSRGINSTLEFAIAYPIGPNDIEYDWLTITYTSLSGGIYNRMVVFQVNTFLFSGNFAVVPP